MALKRYGLDYQKRRFNYLTEQQKKKIFELACKHKRIYTLAAEIGASPYNVRNFLIANRKVFEKNNIHEPDITARENVE